MGWFGRREADRLRDELRVERERLRAAEAVVASLGLVEAAVAAMPFGLVVVDASGNVVMRSAVTVGSVGDVLVDEALGEITSAARRGEALERRLDLAGPPPRSLVLRGLPLPSGGALGIVDDVTERTRLDQVRTDFVANISHELKTPVGGLAVLADTMAGLDDLNVVHTLAERMVIEAHRASSTIDDLLELSRIELGGAIDHEAVSVGALIAEAVARVRTMADAAAVRIVVPAGTGEMVRGDERQLVSAIANLVDNAVKYSDADGCVEVSTRAADGWVEIAVRDRGVGIPAKDLDRVFERFYRVDRARSRHTGGTGLGLAIVRHVANNHGGNVSVESREGEGSTFTLRVPMGEE